MLLWKLQIKEIDSASEDDLQFYSTHDSDSSLNWLVKHFSPAKKVIITK